MCSTPRSSRLCVSPEIESPGRGSERRSADESLESSDDENAVSDDDIGEGAANGKRNFLSNWVKRRSDGGLRRHSLPNFCTAQKRQDPVSSYLDAVLTLAVPALGTSTHIKLRVHEVCPSQAGTPCVLKSVTDKLGHLVRELVASFAGGLELLDYITPDGVFNKWYENCSKTLTEWQYRLQSLETSAAVEREKCEQAFQQLEAEWQDRLQTIKASADKDKEKYEKVVQQIEILREGHRREIENLQELARQEEEDLKATACSLQDQLSQEQQDSRRRCRQHEDLISRLETQIAHCKETIERDATTIELLLSESVAKDVEATKPHDVEATKLHDVEVAKPNLEVKLADLSRSLFKGDADRDKREETKSTVAPFSDPEEDDDDARSDKSSPDDALSFPPSGRLAFPSIRLESMKASLAAQVPLPVAPLDDRGEVGKQTTAWENTDRLPDLSPCAGPGRVLCSLEAILQKHGVATEEAGDEDSRRSLPTSPASARSASKRLNAALVKRRTLGISADVEPNLSTQLNLGNGKQDCADGPQETGWARLRKKALPSLADAKLRRKTWKSCTVSGGVANRAETCTATYRSAG